MTSSLFPSLHVIGSRQMGGAEQFCLRLVRALHEEGQPVTLAMRPASPLAQAVQSDTIEHIPIGLANGWDLWSLWQIGRLVAARKPAIVQTYMGRATRLTRLPRQGHSVHVARLGGFYRIDGYYRHAHAWVGVSRNVCDYMVRQGLPADRVFRIGHFVPPPVLPDEAQKNRLRLEAGIPDSAWLLFALGRFVEKKGFQDLLAAFAQLPATLAGRPLHLMIAGDGPYREALKAQARQLNLTSRLHWLGWQQAPGCYYALADVFVCPSRHEPLGVVQLEAWNYRLPMVTTATDGAEELVTDQDNALVCPVADPDALAGTLLTLLQSPEADRQALGESGYSLLQQRFSRDAIVRQYLELYGQLTGI